MVWTPGPLLGTPRSRMRRPRVLGTLGLVLCLASGCMGTTGHLAVATTRSLDLRAVDLDAPSPRHVVGRSCIRVIGVVPLGIPNFGDAHDDALRQTGAEVLSNVTVRYEIFDVPVVYGVVCD